MKQEWRRAQRDLAPWEIEEMERYYADKVASKDGYDSMSYGGYDRGGDMDSFPLRSSPFRATAQPQGSVPGTADERALLRASTAPPIAAARSGEKLRSLF